MVCNKVVKIALICDQIDKDGKKMSIIMTYTNCSGICKNRREKQKTK